MNRCAARGCGRWIRVGDLLCGRHGAGAGEQRADDDAQERQARFRERLAAGDYDAVLGPGLLQMLRGAAATDAGLEAEVGALRVAMGRLLVDEGDASRLAAGVARVVGVAVQAARVRRGGDGGDEAMQETLRRVLAEIDAEVEERRSSGGRSDDSE